MPDDGGVVRRVAWREICPWLILFRCFRMSISLPILSFATAGCLLTPLGPMIASPLFLDSTTEPATWMPHPDGIRSFIDEPTRTSIGITSMSDPIRFVYSHFTSPFRAAFDRHNTTRETAYHVFSGLWHVAVWAFFAGAITRIAAVQFGREERVDLREALRFATKQYWWSCAAPLFPLFGVLLAAAPIALLGLLLMRFDVGVVLAGLLWPLVLIGGLIMTVLLLGLLAGWPLMWPTISSEEHGDAFEAFARSFSYVFQRPLHYMLYFLVALVFGAVSWLLVSAFSEALVELCLYAASWGASSERIDQITTGENGGVLWAGSWLVRTFNALVRTVATAFHFSFFFCASTAIYLLMRRDVDQSDFDEVFVEDQHDRFTLPPLDPSTGTPAKRDESEASSKPSDDGVGSDESSS
jgi:hypothetical protein